MAVVHKIEEHLLKIDALYAALIKDSLEIISIINEQNKQLAYKLTSHQHVFLEQIAAHRFVILNEAKGFPDQRFNQHSMREFLTEGEIATIEILMKNIQEKLGFMIGVDDQSSAILANLKLNGYWNTRLLIKHKREVEKYYRQARWSLFDFFPDFV